MAELADTLAPSEEDRLDQAEAWVRSYCGWHIAPEREETLTLDGPGGRMLVLPTLHVVGISEVTENGVVLDPATDYFWSASGIIARSGYTCSSWEDPGSYTSHRGYGWWSCQLRGITVTLTHGFEEVPPDVASVVQTVASRMVENPTGLEQQTVGPFSEKYGGAGGALGSTELSILNAYRLPKRT